MKKMLKRLCTGFLALATVVTALPTTPVHAESKQYWTESKERVGIVEKVMNDGSIGSTFNEGHLTVEGEDAYCIDINTDFRNGYKTRADASTRMSADQISDVALSIEYVKQYTDSHNGISKNHAYLLRQLVVWQRLSVHLGWQCDNVRASYDEIPKATQDEVFAGAKAFVKENKGRYECGGYIYSGEGQELGQFWAKLNVGNTVKVYVDADGDMVIVQNPTLAPAVEKSDYEPKTPEADASVDADTVNDATAFLETFFKLYPTATEKELAYYVLGNVIEPIGRDYLYSELVNPIFIKDGDNVKVKVAVKFIDNQTKATQVSQYELVLHKDSNWKIVG